MVNCAPSDYSDFSVCKENIIIALNLLLFIESHIAYQMKDEFVEAVHHKFSPLAPGYANELLNT